MKLPNDALERVVSAFAQIDLGDPRRVERLMHTVQKLAESPQASFPTAMGSEAEIEGAYRLLRNPHVTLEALTGSYAETTAARSREAGKVLVIHDTTTCEFAHADPEEVGYLNTGGAGFFVHYALVVAEGRRPLGVVHVEAFSRSKPPSKRTPGGWRSRKKPGSETRKNDERESLRWGRGFAGAEQRLEGCDVVHVADREGDSYDLLAEAIERRQRFVIRARVSERRALTEDGTAGSVREIAESCEGIVEREVSLSARAPRPEPRARKSHAPRQSRLAKLSFSATTISLPKPRYADGRPDSITLNMVRVFEACPPDGEPPVEWLLFTTEPIASPAEVEAVVDIYRARWLIEECNKALKTGCKYEERHFESRLALLNLLAMTLPIAVELLWLRAVTRTEPTRPATYAITPIQLQILRVMGSFKLPETPTVRDALHAVAALGGHMRSNGDPGWLVLYRGMTKLLAYEEAWIAREKFEELMISR